MDLPVLHLVLELFLKVCIHFVLVQFQHWFLSSKWCAEFSCNISNYLVVQLDGNSHVVYAEEEAAGTRLLIDGRTCLLQVRNVIPNI